ncbi:MAG TPA: chemotaxis protein CheW [Gemmatimonadales bacterium]|nr:chemotaxis protein CheW [Gemmatimonadales bacterium]
MSARKLLLFRARGRVFAVDAGTVREILPATPPTRIPGSPDAVRGLVNVRGTLVTVVDAALAIGLGAGSAPGGGRDGDAGHTLVLMDLASHPIGLIVDEVLDLVTAGDAALAAGGAVPGVRPGVVAATGTAGGERFAQLATDVLLEPLLA